MTPFDVLLNNYSRIKGSNVESAPTRVELPDLEMKLKNDYDIKGSESKKRTISPDSSSYSIKIIYDNMKVVLYSVPESMIPESLVECAKELVENKVPVLEDYLIGLESSSNESSALIDSLKDYLVRFQPENSTEYHNKLNYSYLKMLNLLDHIDEYIDNPEITLNFLKEHESSLKYTSHLLNYENNYNFVKRA